MKSRPEPAVAIEIDVAAEGLCLLRRGREPQVYRALGSRYGLGQERGSFRTPTGQHVIRARIGDGLAPGSVLVGRRPTGEVWSPALAAAAPDRDWILSRILWLSGTEPGHNRLGNVDTMQRFIYIHGAPDHEVAAGIGSIGCIRMSNPDIISLYDQVPVGTPVMIR